jgi:hypothetical protein
MAADVQCRMNSWPVVEHASRVVDAMLSFALAMSDVSLSALAPRAHAVVPDACARCATLDQQLYDLRQEMIEVRASFADEIVNLCQQDIERTRDEIVVLEAIQLNWDVSQNAQRSDPTVLSRPLAALDKAYMRNTVIQFLGATHATRTRMVPVLSRLLELDADEDAFIRKALVNT